MAKVLVTGCTSQQVGRQPGLRYDSVSSLFAEIFRKAGCVVDHRPPVPEEPLEDYDLVLVGLSPLLSLNTTYKYGALDVLRRAEALDRLVLYIDDWQFKSLHGQYATVLRKPDAFTKDFFSYKRDHAWAVAHNAELIETVRRLQDEPWPMTLVPAFTWGDRSHFDRHLAWAPRRTYLDPSILARAYNVTVPEQRERAWVLGALVEKDRWLDGLRLTWPVHRFGKLPKDKGKGERVPEEELVQAYARARGVVSLPYYHAGSGWWRNRFVYAERTGAIVLAAPQEVESLGGDFTHAPADIEALPDGELTELAARQGGVLRSSYASVRELTDTVKALL